MYKCLQSIAAAQPLNRTAIYYSKMKMAAMVIYRKSVKAAGKAGRPLNVCKTSYGHLQKIIAKNAKINL